jgi:hypothetical protein
MFSRSPIPTNSSPTSADIVRHRLEPKTQDGSLQIGSTCISRSIIDRSETRNATSMFSMSAKPINTILIPTDIVRHRKCMMAYYGFAVLHFRCRSMAVDVRIKFIGLADTKNIEISFGISFLSLIEREIQVLPVWRPPFCISGVAQCRRVSEFN